MVLELVLDLVLDLGLVLDLALRLVLEALRLVPRPASRISILKIYRFQGVSVASINLSLSRPRIG